jgi:hypothetical protein
MMARTVSVTLDHDGTSVVEQDMLRDPVKILESLGDARTQGLSAFVTSETYPAHAAIAERRDERDDRLPTAANVCEVSLHLFARWRLEANDRLNFGDAPGGDEFLELRYASQISPLLYLPVQNDRRNPVRPRCVDPL